jgi:hypothetical protein
MSDPPLRFTISLPRSPVSQGDRVVLGLELENVGTSPLYVNCRSAVAPEVGDIRLKVFRDGKEVPFLLRVRLRPLAASDFLQLQPGEHVVAGYVLNRGYRIDAPGLYAVTAEYVSEEVPKELAGQTVFTGTLKADAVTMTVK